MPYLNGDGKILIWSCRVYMRLNTYLMPGAYLRKYPNQSLLAVITCDLQLFKKLIKLLSLQYNYCHCFVTWSSWNSCELHKNQKLSNNKNFKHRISPKILNICRLWYNYEFNFSRKPEILEILDSNKSKTSKFWLAEIRNVRTSLGVF